MSLVIDNPNTVFVFCELWLRVYRVTSLDLRDMRLENLSFKLSPYKLCDFGRAAYLSEPHLVRLDELR
jgi:hypothetical protein